MEKSINIIIPLFKRICYFESSNRQKQRTRECLFLDILFYVNLYLKTFGLEIGEINLIKFEGLKPTEGILPSDHTLEKKKIEYKKFFRKIKVTEESEVFDANYKSMVMQTVRDKINLSFEKYGIIKSELKKLTKCQIPSSNKVVTFMKKMNQFFKIHKNELGVYVDPLEKLTFVLNKSISSC